jgi:hypothetical protein
MFAGLERKFAQVAKNDALASSPTTGTTSNQGFVATCRLAEHIGITVSHNVFAHVPLRLSMSILFEDPFYSRRLSKWPPRNMFTFQLERAVGPICSRLCSTRRLSFPFFKKFRGLWFGVNRPRFSFF